MFTELSTSITLSSAAKFELGVAVDAPLDKTLDYLYSTALPPGTLVLAPLGGRRVCGVVVREAVTHEAHAELAAQTVGATSAPDLLASAAPLTDPLTVSLTATAEAAPHDPTLRHKRLKPLHSVAPIAPLGEAWLALTRFIADYYQQPWGMVMAAALPQPIKLRAHDVLAQSQEALRGYGVTASGRVALAQLPARHRAQVLLAQALLQAATPLTLAQARALHARAKAMLHEWLACGWLTPLEAPPVVPQVEAMPLNEAQREAVQRVVVGVGASVATTTTTRTDAALSTPAASTPSAPTFARGFAVHVLFGVTGSGKTEVYLELTRRCLAQSASTQVLMLVPEINLTPQLVARFTARFGVEAVTVQHSGLAENERALGWLAAHQGRARVVLGTRLGVLASLPGLALILVDEEHDASYKQQDGARYHARDVAVWRARREQVPIVLGSATPSLESWRRVQQGAYQRLDLAQRASGVALPKVEVHDIRRDARVQAGHAVSARALTLMQQARAQERQFLVFINRRGYAPVLQCTSCDWLSHCDHCDAYRVFHLGTRTLQCHLCGHHAPVPRACPRCGNVDLLPLGRGTERVEEELRALLPDLRLARLDADVSRRKGQMEQTLAQVHEGEVEALVGTQMITKGHDFRRVALVVALNLDSGLYSHDFRASERLFAQLMQAAGRAGRGDGEGLLLVQTRAPQHPLFHALVKHDYTAFASAVLSERQTAGLPPFTSLALLSARHQDVARLDSFMQAAAQQARLQARALEGGEALLVYSPVPMPVARVATEHRMQLLLECSSRALMQRFLVGWNAWLAHSARGMAWALDVDPQHV